MIKKTDFQSEHITSATCDCCGKDMLDRLHNLGDHMKIGGHQKGQLLEAVVYIPCMEEKLKFVIIENQMKPSFKNNKLKINKLNKKTKKD